MVTAGNTHVEAVLFMEHGVVARQMLYPEFEAVLDSFVPVPEVANTNVHAVYVRIDGQLCVTAAVFFRLAFDGRGFADRRWNLPLQQLADEAQPGPDLGAGAIRLACASQCPIVWHREQLWDPEMEPGANDFSHLKKTVKANRLGLIYIDPQLDIEEDVQSSDGAVIDGERLAQTIHGQLSQEMEQRFRDRMAAQLKEQRLRISTLNSKHDQRVQQIQLEHQQRLQAYQHEIRRLEAVLHESEANNADLKDKVVSQSDKIEGLREYFEHKLKMAQSDESTQFQALQENYEIELQAKLEAATLELREQLQVQSIELMYRSEQQASLQSEISRLRDENQRLLDNGGNQLLGTLRDAGVSFVAYHPGAGHLTIPIESMAVYLENPTAYAAEKCGVTLHHYEDWLEHHQSPVCRALCAGDRCGVAIDRVASPADFHPGENDRCEAHQSTPAEVFSVARIS